MSIRTIIMLLLALISAAITGLVAFNFMQSQQQAMLSYTDKTEALEVKPSLIAVALVTSRDLKVGQFIRQEDLEWQEWPETSLNDRYITLEDEDANDDDIKAEALDSFKGGVLRSNLLAGQPIQTGHIVFPGDRGFLAAVLEPGMKAVSVAIAKEAGVSGLIFPGDHVDVVVALRLKGKDSYGEATTRFASTTVIENTRVLAIDQTLSIEDDEEALLGKTATLQVSDKQARKIAVARTMGTMSLALRSLSEPEDTVRMADIIDNEEGAIPRFRRTSFFAPVSEKDKKKQLTVKEKAQQNITLDTEIFTVNGRDLSLNSAVVRRQKKSSSPSVVVLRGNQKNTTNNLSGGK